MSFPKYPEYKDSGVEWLGDVPKHWRLHKIAWHVPFTVGWTPPSSNEEYYDGDHLWVTIADLRSHRIGDTKSKITDKAVMEKGARKSPAGSLLFSFKLTVGSVAFLEKSAYTNEAIAAFEPNSHLDLRFWAYAAPIFIPKYGRENIYGALLLNQELISSVRYVAPKIAEQEQIAAFLDHETGQIDALIEEQRRLIELLKEKRQAAISHAVTKGLDPNVPMKDSGVEWLGEVPAHWQVGPLKRVWDVKDCKHVTAEFVEHGYPLASIREVQARCVDLRGAKQTTEEYYRQLVGEGRKPEAGDLIVSRNATVGEISEVADWHPLFSMGQDVCLLKRRFNGSAPGFLYYLFKSEAIGEQINSLLVGATFKRINVEEIRALNISFPPEGEQWRISRFLDREDDRFGRLIGEAERAIELLRERRSALISAGVTGKIDVRGWSAGAEAEAPELAMVAEESSGYSAQGGAA